LRPAGTTATSGSVRQFTQPSSSAQDTQCGLSRFAHAPRITRQEERWPSRHRRESVLRRPRPDFPRVHSRIGSGAQDPRHHVRAIARNNLLPPSVRHRFTTSIHRDEALLATKRRHTTADCAHGLSSGQGARCHTATGVPFRALGVTCCSVNSTSAPGYHAVTRCRSFVFTHADVGAEDRVLVSRLVTVPTVASSAGSRVRSVIERRTTSDRPKASRTHRRESFHLSDVISL